MTTFSPAGVDHAGGLLVAFTLRKTLRGLDLPVSILDPTQAFTKRSGARWAPGPSGARAGPGGRPGPPGRGPPRHPTADPTQVPTRSGQGPMRPLRSSPATRIEPQQVPPTWRDSTDSELRRDRLENQPVITYSPDEAGLMFSSSTIRGTPSREVPATWRSSDRLFEFDCLVDLFATQIIPTQVLRDERAVYYSPARLERFGLP